MSGNDLIFFITNLICSLYEKCHCLPLIVICILFLFNSDESLSRESKWGTLDAHLWVQTWFYLGIKFGKQGVILFAYIESSQASFYSKCRKCLEAMWWYWKGKADYYNKRSDEGADTDSQDERDQGVQPTDLNVMSYKKKKWGGCYHVIMG